MADVATARERQSWGWVDRIPIGLLVVGFALGTPGIGPETREMSSDALLAVLLVVFFLPPVLALAASFRWPLAAARLGILSGILLVVMVALDLAGIIAGPPPTGMIAVDAFIFVSALALLWRSWPLAKS